MTTKHFFDREEGLVLEGLHNLVAVNPYLRLDPLNKVVSDPSHDRTKVSLISGGGSGHEPAWSSYVGKGMLTAVANGDIFASPSAKQVLAAIAAAPSNTGTILVITNYTGDRLHFGLACERAKAQGLVPSGAKISVLPITDDATLPRDSITEGLGRRGLAGNVLVLKAMGAAAEAGRSYDEVLELGKAMNANTVTAGSSLDHCSIPGRSAQRHISQDACVLGMGIHNEQGLKQLSPIPPIESLVDDMLKFILDKTDASRHFVDFDAADSTVVLVNNFGGLSNLELNAISRVVLTRLELKWGFRPKRILCGSYETSLNGPGFSISVSNVTSVATECRLTDSAVLDLINETCYVPGWPNHYDHLYTPAEPEEGTTSSESDVAQINLPVETLTKCIEAACLTGISIEPDLTEWDSIMGDGDCGFAVKKASQDILALVQSNPRPSNSSDLMAAVIDALDDMGGTLGGILSIWLSSFTHNLSTSEPSESIERAIAKAANRAVEVLCQHTAAREGDRTVMDALIPFCRIFSLSHNVNQALDQCQQSVLRTGKLVPKFGRATYVKASESSAVPEVPDPGAWAVFQIIKSMVAAGK